MIKTYIMLEKLYTTNYKRKKEILYYFNPSVQK